MAEARKSFSQYYKEQLAKNPLPVAPRAAPVAKRKKTSDLSKIKLPAAGGDKGGENSPQDPLSWILDIVSRPLYAVTETADTAIELGNKKRNDKIRGDLNKGDMGSLAGAAGELISAPVRGFFSTDRDDKRTGHELIEKATDTVGSYDPKYKDTKDNVNPIVKGVAGFVGDVALDPLTYVPGAAIASVGKKILGISKGATEVVGGAVKGAKEAVTAGKAVKDTARVVDEPSPTPFEALTPDAVPPTAAPEPIALPDIEVPKALDVPVVKTVEDVPVAKTPETELVPVKTSQQIATSKITPMVRTLLDELSNPTVKFPEMDDWIEGYIETGRGTIPNWRKGQPGQPDRIPLKQLQTDMEARAYSKQWLREVAYPTFKEKYTRENAGAVVGEVNPMVEFQKLIKSTEGVIKAEAALGVKLATRLRLTRSPEHFNTRIDEIRNILDHNEHLDQIISAEKFAKPKFDVVRQLLGHMDIDAVATNVKIANAESAVKAAEASRAGVVPEATPDAPAGPVPNGIPASSTGVVDNMGANRAERLDLLDQDRKDLLADLPKPVRDQFFDTDKFGHKTNTGAEATSNTPWEGLHRYSKEFNQYTQYNIIKSISEKVFEQAKTAYKNRPAALKSRSSATVRALFVREEILRKLELTDDLFEREGYQMFIGVHNDKLPLSTAQMIRIMEETGARKGIPQDEVLVKAMFNEKTVAPLLNVFEAISIGQKGGDPDLIKAALARTIKPGVNPAHIGPDGTLLKEFVQADRLPNHLVDPSPKKGFPERVYGYFPGTKKPADGNGYTWVKGSNAGFYKVWGSEHLLDELTDLIVSSRDAFDDVIRRNATALQARINREAVELTEAEIKHLDEVFMDPARLAEALSRAGKITEDMSRLADDAGATGPAQAAARAAVEKLTDESVGKAAKELTASTAKRKKATTAKESADTGKEAAAKAGTHFDEADKLDQQEMLDNIDQLEPDQKAFVEAVAERDISVDAYDGIDTTRNSIFDPLGKLFVKDYGMKNAWQTFHSFGVGSNMRRSSVLKELNALSKKYGQLVGSTTTPVLKEAWEVLRAGGQSANPQVMEAVTDLTATISHRFGLGKGAVLGNEFFRTGASIDHINDAMKRAKLDFEVDASEATRLATENGTDIMEEALKQWRDWDVEDPLSFVASMYAAVEMVATDAGVAQTLARQLGSKTPRAGYVQLTNSKKSRYLAMVPEGTYFSKEAASEFAVLDKMAQATRSIEGDIGKFVNGYYLPVQNAWKVGITIYRPGHHVRNLIGDSIMTNLAEGFAFSKVSSVDAFKVMHARKAYTDIDIGKSLENLGEHELPTGSTILRKSGKFGDISVDDITSAAVSHGLYNPASVLEDVSDVVNPILSADRQTKFAANMNKVALRGTKLDKFATQATESRDHYIRTQHFLQYIYKAEKSGVDDLGRVIKSRAHLFEMAARQVKKYHPDGSMLTPFEAKYLRLIMPFYSWLRGAIPAIVESTLLHPGRAMVFPKASYNLAISMGVDPYSMTDPFPEDQMFPSFLSEQMFGPQFQLQDGTYINVNPGVPQADVANMLLTDPMRGVAGAVSPFLRGPAELLSGGAWGTGAPINDKSDYVDSNIPGVNYLANVTGNSVTGSMLSVLQGKGLDPQLQVAKGNKGPLDKGLSAFNYFTGLGVNNQSKENFQNFAEFEKRERAATGGVTGGY